MLAIVIIAIVGLTAMLARWRNSGSDEEIVIDPHLGMVQVYNGSDYVWITPEEGVPRNPFTAQDFSTGASGEPYYNKTSYATFRGIDVSQHQGDIDWAKVKESGVEFAIIRVGGRGYGDEGKLVEDEKFAANLENAKAAGIKVGVYFFSQAVNTDEAKEEAEFALSLINGTELSLPVYFDWEHIVVGENARTDNLDGKTVTDCAIAFCEKISAAGYKAGIYTNLDTSYYTYELSRLADYDFWSASPGDFPYSYYGFSVWQYSFSGNVPGIEYPCDMDIQFVKYS